MSLWSFLKCTFARASASYSKSAELLFLAALVLAAVLPAMAATISPSVKVNILNSNAGTSFGFCFYASCTPVTVTANLSFTGTYSGPVYFKGLAVVWVHNIIVGDHIANWNFAS